MKYIKTKMDMLYIEPGIMQGLTVRYLKLYLFAHKKMFRISIPLKIVGYDKGFAQKIYENLPEEEK